MECERHQGQQAVGKCLECGAGICPDCVRETGQVLRCPACQQKEVSELAARMSAPPGAAKPAREPKQPKTKKEKRPGRGKGEPEQLEAAACAPPQAVPPAPPGPAAVAPPQGTPPEPQAAPLAYDGPDSFEEPPVYEMLAEAAEPRRKAKTKKEKLPKKPRKGEAPPAEMAPPPAPPAYETPPPAYAESPPPEDALAGPETGGGVAPPHALEIREAAVVSRGPLVAAPTADMDELVAEGLLEPSEEAPPDRRQKPSGVKKEKPPKMPRKGEAPPARTAPPPAPPAYETPPPAYAESPPVMAPPAPPPEYAAGPGEAVALNEFGMPAAAAPPGKKEKPPREKKEKRPKKPKKGEAPAPPGMIPTVTPPAPEIAAPPTYEAPPPEHAEAPPTYEAPPPEHAEAPPTYEAPPPEHAEAPPTYEAPPPEHAEAPPTFAEQAPPVFEEAPPTFAEVPSPPLVEPAPPASEEMTKGTPTADAGGPPEEVAPWEIESAVPSADASAPPVFEEPLVAPGEVPPAYEPQPPVSGESTVPTLTEEPQPPGALAQAAQPPPIPFEEDGGMMEQIRPDHVTEEDYKLPPEYQELIGERPVPEQEPPPPAAEEPPLGGTAEFTVTPAKGDERVEGSYDWPFDEVPPEGGPAQEAGRLQEPSGWNQGTTETDYPADASWAAPPAAPAPPPEEKLDSFFFEDEVQKKKKKKEDGGEPEAFWE